MFYINNIEKGELNPEESRHCVKVLRKRIKDKITLFDGKGARFEAILKSIDPVCEFEVLEETFIEPTKNPIQIAISPPKKSSRLDFMIEKLIELGANNILLFNSQHAERHRIKEERIHKQVITASKQCRQYYLPLVNTQTKIEDIIALNTNLFVCHCNLQFERKLLSEVNLTQENQTWLIGPEGDFSDSELKLLQAAKATFVNLGEMRLRTETAAMYVCAVLKNARS